MTTGRVRTIWLSDTHLGTRGCRARDLLDFLDSHECEYLYLVGDIIDFWRLKRSPYWAQLHSDVIRAVLSKARAGTTVTFVPGNHDEYLRRFCDLQLGSCSWCTATSSTGSRAVTAQGIRAAVPGHARHRFAKARRAGRVSGGRDRASHRAVCRRVPGSHMLRTVPICRALRHTMPEGRAWPAPTT